MVRCKFVCAYKQPSGDGVHVYFNPVTSGSDENQKFFRFTPGGQIAFYTVNLEAAEQLEQGKEYYVDFSPAQ